MRRAAAELREDEILGDAERAVAPRVMLDGRVLGGLRGLAAEVAIYSCARQVSMRTREMLDLAGESLQTVCSFILCAETQ